MNYTVNNQLRTSILFDGTAEARLADILAIMDTHTFSKLHKTQPQACPTNAPYAYGKIKTDGSGLVRTEAVSTALTRKRNVLPTIRKHWEKK